MPQDPQPPFVKWDPDTRQFEVSLPTPEGFFDARWVLPASFVLRIKEEEADEWSPGFETPFNRCTFRDLKPDTTYILELRAKTDEEIGKPVYSRARTLADGTVPDFKPIPNWPLLE